MYACHTPTNHSDGAHAPLPDYYFGAYFDIFLEFLSIFHADGHKCHHAGKKSLTKKKALSRCVTLPGSSHRARAHLDGAKLIWWIDSHRGTTNSQLLIRNHAMGVVIGDLH